MNNYFLLDVTRALAGVGLVNIQRRIAYLENDYNNVTKFLNRILGLPVDLQNRLFKYYTDVLQHIVTKVKKSGRYDLEILGVYYFIITLNFFIYLFYLFSYRFGYCWRKC